MQLDTDKFKASFMVDGGMLLFTSEPNIEVIQKMELMLRDIATEMIKDRLRGINLEL